MWMFPALLPSFPTAFNLPSLMMSSGHGHVFKQNSCVRCLGEMIRVIGALSFTLITDLDLVTALNHVLSCPVVMQVAI
jgi:hypothetical protein